LSKNYGKIITDNKIDAIGYPKINITKLGKGNPLGFTITVATLPVIKLPDYKKLAKKINEVDEKVEVTEEEFEKIVKQARTIRAKEIAKGGEIDENNLPEIDDEYVKTLGGFENRADFDKKIKENILEEKKLRAKDKKRLEIIESIISETELDIPEVLIDSEIHKMIH
jgi:FKBP-type peptidyl-prolyl cis-trans isomerase (trigger factor)